MNCGESVCVCCVIAVIEPKRYSIVSCESGLTYAINIDGIPLIRRNSAANIDGIPRQIDGIPNCACMLGRPSCTHNSEFRGY